eukprot:XP_016664017.1 PREDICTED: uncharacterized protein LOC107885094 [Acyrthosiphon pisum]
MMSSCEVVEWRFRITTYSRKFELFLTIFERVMLSQIFVSSISLIILGFNLIMKDSIKFALYSSNWTEMDMKCKQLILLTMQLNNANQKKLRFSRTKIVNMEMFFKTMGHCYSVLSVLINYMNAKND